MNLHFLRVLNRRFDRVFADMEAAWERSKANREDQTARAIYINTLRRADRLWVILKPFSNS